MTTTTRRVGRSVRKKVGLNESDVSIQISHDEKKKKTNRFGFFIHCGTTAGHMANDAQPPPPPPPRTLAQVGHRQYFTKWEEAGGLLGFCCCCRQSLLQGEGDYILYRFLFGQFRCCGARRRRRYIKAPEIHWMASVVQSSTNQHHHQLLKMKLVNNSFSQTNKLHSFLLSYNLIDYCWLNKKKQFLIAAFCLAVAAAAPNAYGKAPAITITRSEDVRRPDASSKWG